MYLVVEVKWKGEKWLGYNNSRSKTEREIFKIFRGWQDVGRGSNKWGWAYQEFATTNLNNIKTLPEKKKLLKKIKNIAKAVFYFDNGAVLMPTFCKEVNFLKE